MPTRPNALHTKQPAPMRTCMHTLLSTSDCQSWPLHCAHCPWHALVSRLRQLHSMYPRMYAQSLCTAAECMTSLCHPRARLATRCAAALCFKRLKNGLCPTFDSCLNQVKEATTQSACCCTHSHARPWLSRCRTGCFARSGSKFPQTNSRRTL